MLRRFPILRKRPLKNRRVVKKALRATNLRRTPIRKRRPGIRRGQLTASEKAAIRLAVYERAGGRCELRLMPDCIKGILPWDGPDPFSHGHLVHLKSRGAGGKWTMENCRWGCWRCHLIGIHQQGLKAKGEEND